MVIGKFQEYIGDKGVTIQSKRLIEEMKTFIWRNGRPEAQSGYNDDLVMSFSIAMYIRDTAFKFKQQRYRFHKSYRLKICKLIEQHIKAVMVPS